MRPPIPDPSTDLARDQCIFIESVDSTEPVVTIRNDYLAGGSAIDKLLLPAQPLQKVTKWVSATEVVRVA